MDEEITIQEPLSDNVDDSAESYPSIVPDSADIHLDDDSINRLVDAFKEFDSEEEDDLQEEDDLEEEDDPEEEDDLQEEDDLEEEDDLQEEDDLEEEDNSDLLLDGVLSESEDSLQTSVVALPQEFYDKMDEIRVENFYFNAIFLGLLICLVFVFGIKR